MGFDLENLARVTAHRLCEENNQRLSWIANGHMEDGFNVEALRKQLEVLYALARVQRHWEDPIIEEALENGYNHLKARRSEFMFNFTNQSGLIYPVNENGGIFDGESQGLALALECLMRILKPELVTDTDLILLSNTVHQFEKMDGSFLGTYYARELSFGGQWNLSNAGKMSLGLMDFCELNPSEKLFQSAVAGIVNTVMVAAAHNRGVPPEEWFWVVLAGSLMFPHCKRVTEELHMVPTPFYYHIFSIQDEIIALWREGHQHTVKQLAYLWSVTKLLNDQWNYNTANLRDRSVYWGEKKLIAEESIKRTSSVGSAYLLHAFAACRDIGIDKDIGNGVGEHHRGD